MRSDRERLLDILEAIDRIEKYAVRGRDTFDAEELVQTWIVHHLAILGEATRSLSTAFREHHPEVPWSRIVGLRNVLVHEYFGIDRDAVWSAVVADLPPLKALVSKALALMAGLTEGG